MKITDEMIRGAIIAYGKRRWAEPTDDDWASILQAALAPIEAFGGDAEERLHREATKAGSRLPTTPFSPLSPIKEGSR